MIIWWLAGVLVLLLDGLLLYYSRDFVGDKILCVWMVILMIISAIIPIFGLIIGIIVLAYIALTDDIKLINSKFTNWLDKKI